jgi:[amino group carrier protein]-L-2-aminoadipate 6-kinase
VIKVGGSLGSDMSRACADITALVSAGCSVVVVHGGGAESDKLALELGRRTKYLTSTRGRRSRYTDAEALDSLTLGMLGRVKPPLLVSLLGMGVNAVGLSGVDGGLVTARRTPPARVVVDGEERVVRDDLSGRVVAVNPTLVTTLLDAGYVPVVSPPALDPVAGPLNVDADRFAAELAMALAADWLIILSNVPGLLRDQGDPMSLVPTIPVGDLPDYLDLAGGRMKVKVRSAGDACAAGVRRVVLADGRNASPVLAARAGAGTTFVGGVG